MAIFSVFGLLPTFHDVDPPKAASDEIIDRAVANGDEHAIKFTEACLREHALNPKPVYLAASLDVVGRL